MISHKKPTFSIEEVKIIGHNLGIDWEHFDVDEFRLGLDLERQEHGSRNPLTDLTHNDPLLTGKIVLAHLQKIPDYYSRLAQMENEAADISPDIDRWVRKYEANLYNTKQAASWSAMQQELRLRLQNLNGRIDNLQALMGQTENGVLTELDDQIRALQADRDAVYERKRETLAAQQRAITDSMKQVELQAIATVMKVRAKFRSQINQLVAERDAVNAQWQADSEAQLIAWHAEITKLQAGLERATLTQFDTAFPVAEQARLRQLQSNWHDLRAALEDQFLTSIAAWSFEIEELKARRTGYDTWEEFEREQQIKALASQKSQVEVKLQSLRNRAASIHDATSPPEHSQPEWLGYSTITFH